MPDLPTPYPTEYLPTVLAMTVEQALGFFEIEKVCRKLQAMSDVGLVVRGAGVVIALPLLVIVSALASARFRWKTALLEAAGITLFCIVVFLKGLGVPLPVLGSWFGN